MSSETVKGFSDFVGEEARKRKKIISIIENEFESFGFEPAETPVLEYEDFVVGENKNDEAVRDIFRLKDRGERELALRYEFTFQLKRIAKRQKLPYKRYQIGYNFRDEPIRKGRMRQFIQCDADIIGSNVKDEAEILAMASAVFKKLDMPVKIFVNNRKLMNEILVELRVDEKIRTDVIREIDKLDKLSPSEVAQNLAKLGCERVLDVFQKKEEYFERYKFYEEIKNLKKYCTLYGVDVEFRPYLARGFSYYNGTVFEVWSEKINVAICGGGSFLIDNVQSTGIALGLEPISLICDLTGDSVDLMIISIDQDKKVIELADKIRAEGKKVQVMTDKGLMKAMDYANSKKIKKIIVVGKKEIENKEYEVKDMNSGEAIKIKEKDLIKKI
jgi:histidyl-tRNA synthetase